MSRTKPSGVSRLLSDALLRTRPDAKQLQEGLKRKKPATLPPRLLPGVQEEVDPGVLVPADSHPLPRLPLLLMLALAVKEEGEEAV